MNVIVCPGCNAKGKVYETDWFFDFDIELEEAKSPSAKIDAYIKQALERSN